MKKKKPEPRVKGWITRTVMSKEIGNMLPNVDKYQLKRRDTKILDISTWTTGGRKAE